MPRKKMLENEKNERLAYQIALCNLAKSHLVDKTDGEIEQELAINNKSGDGSVFRRLKSGKQIASTRLLASMLNNALSKDPPFFTENEYYNLIANFKDVSDDSIINDHLNTFDEQLTDVIRLTSEGSIKVRLKLIEMLKKSLKMIREGIHD